MTEQEALVLAAEIREALLEISGCDQETAEEVQDRQLAITLKKLADWIKNNP